jgi:hypothetical protein
VRQSPFDKLRARNASAQPDARALRQAQGPERALSLSKRTVRHYYFFLPWFFTASIAAAAASGSRYLPPTVTGVKSSFSS